MKVLLVGYHNPNFTNSTVYRDQAVGYLGHELISFEDRAFFLPGRVRDRWPALQCWDLERLNQNLVQCARQNKPDLCLVVGGQRALPETVRAIKKLGIKTALWTTDAPVDFQNVLNAAPSYDQLFCAGSEALDIFQSHGLRHAQWLPFACDPRVHKPMALTPQDQRKYGKDIAFVGSFYHNRARLLESLVDLDIQVWGPYWDRLDPGSPLRNKATTVKLNYDEWVRIYAAAKIVLVIHYQDPKVPCHQASPKLFEAMACKGFIFCDSQKDAQALFTHGKHVVFFTDAQDLREKIKYYLAREDQRHTIAQQGFEEVVSKHTYEHRIAKIIAATCYSS